MSLLDSYVINNTNRKDNDFYPTAPIATLTLLKEYDNIPKSIWEPCAGKGHISKELIRNGFDVYSSDLFKYENSLVNIEINKDFLTCELPNVNGIITNPPYKHNLPEKLLKRMLEHYDFIALFCRITFLESSRRYDFFKNNPPAKILIFSERVNCDEKYFEPKEKQIGGMICYAWFIWDKNNPIKNQIDWIKPSKYLNDLESDIL